MWHIEPTSLVAVSVKRNPGQTKHAECLDRGYINLPPSPGAARPPVARAGQSHLLRAVLEGKKLHVTADGASVWDGTLPDQAFEFDGPVGIRSDNGVFDFELRVPGGGHDGVPCVGPSMEPD